MVPLTFFATTTKLGFILLSLGLLTSLFGCGSSDFTSLAPDVFAEALENDSNAVVLDVRTAAEFQAGHLPGAHNLDFLRGAVGRAANQLDPEKTYYVYCKSGGRNSAAAGQLVKKGIPHVVNLKGGILAWQGPVER